MKHYNRHLIRIKQSCQVFSLLIRGENCSYTYCIIRLIRTLSFFKEEEDKLALFMKRIINFQQMIRCKEVLIRKDWRIINHVPASPPPEDGL